MVTFSETNAARWWLEVNGEVLPLDVHQRLLQMAYDDNEDKIDELVITFSNRNMQLQDAPYFQEGNEIRVSWGYPGNMAPPKTCIIKKAEPKFEYENLTLKVTAYGKACILAGPPLCGVWVSPDPRDANPLTEGDWPFIGTKEFVESDPVYGYTPSEIAIRVAYAFGLKPVVWQSKNRQIFHQTNENFYDFLKRIAKTARWGDQPHQIGFGFWVEGDELHFEPIRNDEDPFMTFTYFCDDEGMLKEFFPVIDAQGDKGAASEVTVVGYDSATMKITGFVANKDTTGKTARLGSETTMAGGAAGENKFKTSEKVAVWVGDVNPKTNEKTVEDDRDPLRHGITSGVIQGPAAAALQSINMALWLTTQAVQPYLDKAVALKQAAEMAQIKAEATIVGWPRMRKAVLIGLLGLGTKYSGLYRVNSCRHLIAGGAYSCKLKVSRNAKGVDQGDKAAPAGGVANDKEGSPIPPEKEPVYVG